jgi:transcriptional regulator of acetoin/glycerol metabolism
VAGGRNGAAFPADAPRPCISLRSVEEQAIRAALRHEGGNMSRAARALGISRATLYRRINGYDAEAGTVRPA